MPHKNAQARYEYQKAYRKRTRAKRAADRPDQDRARHANRRAQLHGVPGTIRLADVRRVLYAEAVCAYCGTRERLGLDHIVAMARGGPNTPDNLQACCLSCNISKYQGDAPGRWARKHDCCQRCGTTERKHRSGGYCNACYIQVTKALAATSCEVHLWKPADWPDVIEALS